jgi:integrase
VIQAAGVPASSARKLAALAAFYAFQARRGGDVAGLLTAWQASGRRGGWKPFLHHISKSTPQARRVIALKAPVKLPRVVTAREIQAILDACGHLRDRLLFARAFQRTRERSSGPSLTGGYVVRPARPVLRPPPTPSRRPACFPAPHRL